MPNTSRASRICGCDRGASGGGRRFLAHEAVEDSDNMDTYQAKLAGRSGYKPISQEDIDQNHARKAAALKLFGDSFKGRYGWAVDLGVHASSRGVRLNVLERGQVRAPLAGPTNIGLAEPGHGALISLVQVTRSLLVHSRPLTGDPTPLVILKAVLTLTDEAGNAFHAADKRLEEKETRFSARGSEAGSRRADDQAAWPGGPMVAPAQPTLTATGAAAFVRQITTEDWTGPLGLELVVWRFGMPAAEAVSAQVIIPR